MLYYIFYIIIYIIYTYNIHIIIIRMCERDPLPPPPHSTESLSMHLQKKASSLFLLPPAQWGRAPPPRTSMTPTGTRPAAG